MRFAYLHGFASGPESRKARIFRDSLEAAGHSILIPDLEENDFEHLTVTGQLRVIERTLARGPVRLIGSSMGGYLAALYASKHPEVERLVLLAPAFDFASRWREISGPDGIEQWRESGWLDLFHYGRGAMRSVHYGLFEDSLRHPASPDFLQPARIYHGTSDRVVPVGSSREFVGAHPNVSLTEFASDHTLLDVLGSIVSDGVPFLTR